MPSIKLILPTILSLREPIAITSHEHTDLDGAASAYALNRLLRSLGKDSFLYIPQPSAEAKRIKSEERSYSSAVVVDTNNPERVRIRGVPTVVIDHHSGEYDWDAIKFVFPTASSTSEIVALMLKYRDIEPSKDVAEALFRGILSDTKGFRYASKLAFEAASFLREYIEIEDLFEPHRPLSSRIASLKAAQRASIYKINDCIIALSHVSAYESKAASDLLCLGADVAIVYSRKRVVVRSRFPLLSLAKELNAGGHEKAFVIVTDSPELIADKFKERVVSRCKKLDETKKRESYISPL